MFTKSFQRALTVILLGLTFATLPSLTYAVHSWGGYHWARTANPFTLKLDDNLTTSDWKGRLAQASQDWNSPQAFSTTSPLVTVIQNGPTLIETDNAGSASYPEIAMDATGNAIAVWYQYDGERNNIWSNRFTAGGGWGAATLIETNNVGSAFLPQIALDASGNAIAVWYQSDGARDDIWSNRFTAGSGWGAATLIETNNDGHASAPEIVLDGNGNGIAVWYQYDGVRNNIWSNRYTAGSGWGAATLIETNNTGNATDPQIAMDASGNAIAVWDQFDGVRNNIWSNRYTAGSGWGAARLIETDNAGAASLPQIAMNANGNAAAVWYQFDGTRNNMWATDRFTAPNSSCAMVAGTTQVCNGSYGSTGWLGLASINITATGLHITQGSAKLNDTYFNMPTYNNPNERLHVMCQEIAHTFGLDHQSTNGSSQNSCMDYFSNTGANATSTLSTRPNLHDFDQLNIIYSHLDTTTTLAATTSLATLAAGSDDDTNWGHLMSQSSNGRSSTYERHNSDGTSTITHVYWTLEAAANCSSCDHRYDH